MDRGQSGKVKTYFRVLRNEKSNGNLGREEYVVRIGNR